MTRTLIPLAMIGAAWIGGPAVAATPVGQPVVANLPLSAAPSVPAGLKVTCMNSPTTLNMATSCPVVQYNGYSVWAYSFIDNRVSMALVTYDSNNRIVGNITKNGARYVWNVTPDGKAQIVEFFGQSNQFVEATWGELFPGAPSAK